MQYVTTELPVRREAGLDLTQCVTATIARAIIFAFVWRCQVDRAQIFPPYRLIQRDGGEGEEQS
jgi:hypothetical protein